MRNFPFARGLCLALVALGLTITPIRLEARGWTIPARDDDRTALSAVTQVVCHRQIVLLGEAAHGNGHSDAFKSALVERLVDQCRFRAVLFESSFYEHVLIWRAKRDGKPITRPMVATAIGGLWKFNREFQPLLDFLTRRANKDLFLGGIDFQLGGLDQDFANAGMIAELTANLDPATRATCRKMVEARIQTGLTAEHKAIAAECVRAIRQVLPEVAGAQAREQRAMLQNLEAFFASDYEGGPGKFIAARDLQMFVNLKFLQSRLPKGTKIIVWTANAHAANGADESNGFAGVRNLGSYVFEEFGRRGFALGTTAFAGSQRWGRERKALPDAPAGSFEALAFSGGGIGSVYYDQRALRRLGPLAAAPFGYRYVKAEWWRRFDGLVVFREEHAAFSSRYGN